MLGLDHIWRLMEISGPKSCPRTSRFIKYPGLCILLSSIMANSGYRYTLANSENATTIGSIESISPQCQSCPASSRKVQCRPDSRVSPAILDCSFFVVQVVGGGTPVSPSFHGPFRIAHRRRKPLARDLIHTYSMESDNYSPIGPTL